MTRRAVLLSAAVLGAVFLGCHRDVRNTKTEIIPSPAITAALEKHQQELMAIPGVVGVYVGLLADEKTPCIKVMLASGKGGMQPKIPKQFDGVPVLTEVTGEIRPLNQAPP